MPTVHMLLDLQLARKVVLATVERGTGKAFHPSSPDVEWIPLPASNVQPRALARAIDMVRMKRKLVGIVRQRSIQCIIARTSMAGNLALWVSQATKVPFIVESFEPHTAYMVESGVWSARGSFAIFAQWMERLQMKRAFRLICVTRNYQRELVRQGIPPERLDCVPSPVDLNKFKFEQDVRQKLRHQLDWNDRIIAVYVGKFGGIYHALHAYRTFKKFHDRFGDRARSMILTPTPRPQVEQGMIDAGVPMDHIIIKRMDPDDIPRYLSAADLAFSLHRNTPSSRFLSPIKNGEYWANGLPILQSRGVSDDSDIIHEHLEGGALFDPAGDDVIIALERIEHLLQAPGQRYRTMELAAKFRPPDRLGAVYQGIFQELWAKADRSLP